LAPAVALLCAAMASTPVRAGWDDRPLIPRFDEQVRGVIVDGGIGTGMVGDTLMFELGGQWSAVRSYGRRRWLVQWDGLLAARGGYLANEHPYLFLIGGHELAWAELGPVRGRAPRQRDLLDEAPRARLVGHRHDQQRRSRRR
jgi:hypothetical protein